LVIDRVVTISPDRRHGPPLHNFQISRAKRTAKNRKKIHKKFNSQKFPKFPIKLSTQWHVTLENSNQKPKSYKRKRATTTLFP
jgi:hypothetical protein